MSYITGSINIIIIWQNLSTRILEMTVDIFMKFQEFTKESLSNIPVNFKKCNLYKKFEF